MKSSVENKSIDTNKDISVEEISEVDILVSKAKQAAEHFRSYTQNQVDTIVARVSAKTLPHSMELAKMVVDERKFGVIEDNYLKIRSVIEFINNDLRGKKSVGEISRSAEGIVEFAEPVGVIAGVLNCTGTGAIDYNKVICALKTRNSIVLAPHPRTKKSSLYITQLLTQYAEEAGAPKGCIQCISQPSVDSTSYLLRHKDVAVNWATGGSGLVRSAYSSGKPSLGVGPGNTPVYIDEFVDTDFVAESILISKTFDAATTCTAESNLFVNRDIKPALYKSFEKYGYYILKDSEKKSLQEFMFIRQNDKKTLNSEIVGQDVSEILRRSGIAIDITPKMLVCELDKHEIGPDFPLSGEKLCNVLSLYTVETLDEGIELTKQTLQLSGKGHTASIFSQDERVLNLYSESIPCSRIVANSPATHGAVFDDYNRRIPTYSFGCGIMGGNITTESINYRNLLDIKRYSNRMREPDWYIIPDEVYKDIDAKKYLSTLENRNIFCVIDPGITGFVTEYLKNCLPESSSFHVSNDVEPDPSFEIVEKGYNKLREANPDTIIAIGGGSAIDAAKGMWIRYEYPDMNIRDVAQPFFDIWRQVGQLPKKDKKAKFIAIPTTCGTGSEATCAAVFTDTAQHRKYLVFSYEITPDVAVLLPEFIEKLPKHIMIDTAFDALTHAIESFVSIKDCAAADLNAIKAARLIFENLEDAVNKDSNEAKKNLLYASFEAGKSISNSFIGVNHSLAHQIGSQFKIPHGRANALFLISVIRFNSREASVVFRFTPYPNVAKYRSLERYAELAKKALRLDYHDPLQCVDKLCESIAKLKKAVGIENKLSDIKSFSISFPEYQKKIPQMSENAFQDVSNSANPIVTSIAEFEQLFEAVY